MNFLVIHRELLSHPIIQSSDLLQGICASVLAMYPDGVPVLPWAGYLLEENGIFVGTCAYKSRPVGGAVEIAYFTFPDHEGRGMATHMASHLVAVATQNGVAQIRAQTLPEENASTSILRKLGFVLVGSVQHPDDGEVWEWRK